MIPVDVDVATVWLCQLLKSSHKWVAFHFRTPSFQGVNYIELTWFYLSLHNIPNHQEENCIFYHWTNLLWSSYIGGDAQQRHSYTQGECVHDVNVHGKKEFETSCSQAKPPLAHIRLYCKAGVGSYARTLGQGQMRGAYFELYNLVTYHCIISQTIRKKMAVTYHWTNHN